MSRRRKRNQERRKADDLLAAWQLERLEQDRALPLPARGPSEVTLVAHFVPPRDRLDERFPRMECAIRPLKCSAVHAAKRVNASLSTGLPYSALP